MQDSDRRPITLLTYTSNKLGHGFETVMVKGQNQSQSTLYFYFGGP